MRADSSAEAARKTVRAWNSSSSCDSASITRTPVTRPARGSQMTLGTTLLGRRVSRPVASAVGSVELIELK